jgi:hypothetical protein
MTIEYCINDEWLASGICDDAGIDHCYMGEVAGIYIETAVQYAEDAGLEVVRAQGQRIMYHSWNGAHFVDRFGIFGSWFVLTAEERQILTNGNLAGLNAATKYVAKIVKTY